MGSQFSVYLPGVANKLTQQLEEQADSAGLKKTESIMLVDDDDDADIRQFQKELFADHGYKILQQKWAYSSWFKNPWTEKN